MVEEMEVSGAGEQQANNGAEQQAPNPEENAKNLEYIKQLMREKLSLDPETNSLTMRLLDEELAKAQKGKNYEAKPVHDLSRDRPIRASVKISLPIKEHPRFNFVGKLLGPKGSTLKRLQEETMTKMAILGRGSMRDKNKEDECRASLDPKYSHLSDELHVEIFATGPPAEAHARLSYALVEVKKYLTPDDEVAPPEAPRAPRPARGGFRGGHRGGGKGMSILDRARMSMDGGFGQFDEGPGGYGYEGYDEGPGGYGPEFGPAGGPGGRWKGYGGPKPAIAGGSRFPPRPSPYGRPK
ncbi:hypothetical protein GE061_008793 [Apolygus lucorum]|uniref:K Homology domain-containing protein n=1 Tax=Apolygus lucorum TaxID=248454 RepID=A0A8S9WQX4_APOLU|nr:hypothetical protein GE061_008793 [Apolygus lucorum]